jgi:L-rhamnose mutarotase
MRVCFVLNVHPDKVEEYKERHAHVWPEMLDALRETGWRNYSIFLRPDGLLIGYLEAENFDESCAAMKEKPVNEQWQAWMASFFAGLDMAAADAHMIPLEEVFHLD